MGKESHIFLIEGMYKGNKGLKLSHHCMHIMTMAAIARKSEKCLEKIFMNRQKSFENQLPTLYIVATPIGNLSEMTYRAVEILKSVDYIAAEDTRNTIKLLNHFEISTKLVSHHEHNLSIAIPKIIQDLKDGCQIALVSDAGYPAISDPGYELVKEVIKEGMNVVPISGANACLDALVVSGIAPQPFTFYGFLDRNDKRRRKNLKT